MGQTQTGLSQSGVNELSPFMASIKKRILAKRREVKRLCAEIRDSTGYQPMYLGGKKHKQQKKRSRSRAAIKTIVKNNKGEENAKY